ncbi:MAG: sigma-70 family RNA polymerase sigma factor [Planctomycetes bacterium]|nr:sigma-70 family RNA polymerase sigma factor [Planctomycetota bacterium]
MGLPDSIDRLRSSTPDEAPHAGRTDTSPGTKDILDALALDPNGGWERLIARAESKLRILLHFRMSPRLRGVLAEEDLLQEVWAEGARNLERFEYRGPGSLQRWFAGILSNKLLHAGREAWRVPMPASAVARESTIAALASRRLDLAQCLPATQSSVSGHARKRELEERVRDVLLRLPEAEREVILLKLFEGLNGREAALRLGVDESTVSVRFKRALETCARQLKEYAP